MVTRPQPQTQDVPSLEDATFYSLNLGVGLHNLMWTVESGTRSVTRADGPQPLELRGKLYLYVNGDEGEQEAGRAWIPTISEGVEIQDFSTGAANQSLNTNFSNGARSADFSYRRYNDVVDDAYKAVYTPDHVRRYGFFAYNVDDNESYRTFTDAVGVEYDCSDVFTAVTLTNESIRQYMTEGTPLQWNNLPKLSPFCAWMHSDVVRTRESGNPDKRDDGTVYDGNLVLLPRYDMESKFGYDVYVPFIMHPSMAMLRLNYKLSYAYAMQSGGAAHDDVGFREFHIKSVVLRKFPDNDTDVSIVIKKADGKDYALLRSDVSDGEFTEVATIYAAPTTATLTVPMTITYDAFDRKGNLLRQNETVDASFTITQRLEGGKYYDINLSIVPSFLYVMSDIDPDSPNDYIIVK